jgi:hypothetical protein
MNITLRNEGENMAKNSIPCVLCKDNLPVRTDKNNKPYFVCIPCGIQLFVRGQQGIERLRQAVTSSDSDSQPQVKTRKRLLTLLDEMQGEVVFLQELTEKHLKPNDLAEADESLVGLLGSLLEVEELIEKS